MKNRKPHWHEMTVSERLQDQLRHFPTLLARWHGGVAAVRELTTSHPTLTIRVESEARAGNLEICCSPPDYYCSPFEWNDANIAIALDSDDTAGVTIRTTHASLFENRKPLNVLVVPRGG